MGDPSTAREALSLLGEVYRERRTGVLSVETSEQNLRVAVRAGEVVGIGPPPGPPPPAPDPAPDPDDSVSRRLEQVLVEVGLHRPRGATRGPSVAGLREGLVSSLSGQAPATFHPTTNLPRDALSLSGGSEPLILEAVRRVEDARIVETLLGDLDRVLGAHSGRSRERTLTLTEGALLSRVDGIGTARQVLERAPLEAEDARRGLAGLLLTGRVEYQADLGPEGPQRAEPSPQTPDTPPGTSPSKRAEPARSVPAPEDAASPEPLGHEGPLSVEADREKQEIQALFQALPHLSHFEVLGLEPGCADSDVRRAYVARVKRFHPDAQRHPSLHDLHDVLEAIFIRVSEASEALSTEEKRTAYAARLGAGAGGVGEAREAGARGSEEGARDAGDRTLDEARELLAESRFWDAIQVLEAAVPRLQPQARRHRGQLLLARAYARNPKWVRRAEKTLQGVVGEDPANAEAHYQLGLLYKSGGLTARAQAMFRKAVELRPGYREASAQISTAPAPRARPGLLRRLFRG